jgi:molybdopterin-guanine dinucleotide biosynthesis protein B
MSTLSSNPAVFTYVGHSGSGKITLIEKLLHELSNRGLRVATIKYEHHKSMLDTPGKNTWSYKQAGAMISMPVTSGVLQSAADAVEWSAPEQLAKRFISGVDMVLADGFSQVAEAKIEVLCRESPDVPRCAIEDGLIALATDVDELMKSDSRLHSLFDLDTHKMWLCPKV